MKIDACAKNVNTLVLIVTYNKPSQILVGSFPGFETQSRYYHAVQNWNTSGCTMICDHQEFKEF